MISNSFITAVHVDESLCFVCKEAKDDLYHFLFVWPYFRKNFDSLWSNLDVKASNSCPTDGEPLKIYLQVKFLGIIFDSKLTFQKHFEDILERCNHRYHRLRLLANKNGGLAQPP